MWKARGAKVSFCGSGMRTLRSRILSAWTRAAGRWFGRDAGGITVVVQSMEVKEGGIGVSPGPQSKKDWSIGRVLFVTFFSVLVVPMGLTCKGAWHTWDERRDAEVLKRLQREAQRIEERLDVAAHRERNQAGMAYFENGDHEYR